MIFMVLVIITLFGLYFHLTRNFSYWRVRKIKYVKPMPLFGTFAETYLLKKSFTQVVEEIYWKYPEEKVVGVFRASRPGLVLRDPMLIKQVMSTDFAYFYPRGINLSNAVAEPLLKNLFFADGDLWRLLRQRMTPAFTSSKLRAMFPLVVERAARLQERALAAAAAGRAVDVKDLMARYTVDFIGACGFGLDADTLNDENSSFQKLAYKIFEVRFKDALVIYSRHIFPGIFGHLKVLGEVEAIITNLVTTILEKRNYQPSGRNDFIDLLLECKRKGIIIGESIEKRKEDGSPELCSLELDEQLMIAQVFIFFAAGYETSSSATSFALHQLAFHPDIQKKVQEEIDRVLAKYENKLNYDSIKEMTYLEWTFCEAMRMFPSLGCLNRRCAQTYTFPGLNLTIDEGVRVLIPVQALHNDPKYFESPEEFRPERFDPEVFDPSLRNIYIPFGFGPRSCIGERLGRMQSLAGLAAVLAQCSVLPAPQTRRRLRVAPTSQITQRVEGGLPLIFMKRNMPDR